VPPALRRVQILERIQRDAIHIVVCPRELDQHMRMIAGWTVEFVSDLNFAVAPLTAAHRPLADVVNAARASAERSVGLIDATKFGRASLLSIARAQELDASVTDAALAPAVAETYRAAGGRLELANHEEGP
jgi:DeoR/GlpR family transcriptional regulator of sugar metabolism